MRILFSSFKEPSNTLVYLPETSESFKAGLMSTTELINQSIIEVLFQISSGLNPLKNLSQNSECDSLNNFSVSPTHTLSPSPSPVGCPVPLLPFKTNDTAKTPESIAVEYLMDCYSRVATEERNHPKRSSIPPLSDVLSDLREQLVHFMALILQGYIVVPERKDVSPLLVPLLQQTLPRGFITELVMRTQSNQRIFAKIFNPILQGLFLTMQNASVVGNEHRHPIHVLNELAEIRCGSRPICTLLTQQIQFLPETCTQAAGRELTRTSFLGPFLSVSVFAEDEPKVAEKFFSGNTSSDKSLNQTLQQELENTRLLLHKIFHDVLANVPSRDAMLEYMASLLKNNEKRAQLQMEERNLAGDGFMLNLLSIMQMLAIKVKLDKVDFLYPFHPNSVIDIKNDTRLRFTSQETSTWLEEIGTYFEKILFH